MEINDILKLIEAVSEHGLTLSLIHISKFREKLFLTKRGRFDTL